MKRNAEDSVPYIFKIKEGFAVKKVFVAIVVCVFLLTSYSMHVAVNTYAAESISPSTILHGTFYELILSDLDSRFASVFILDNYNDESVFYEGLNITRQAEVRRLLNVLGAAELVSAMDTYLVDSWSAADGVRLNFTERGAPGTEVTSPLGTHRDQLNIIVFPEQGLISVLFNFEFPARYFYFEGLDMHELLGVSPLSLLNHGTPLAFIALWVIAVLVLYYWFGGDHYMPMRKAVSVRNYIISVWLMLFIIAMLMIDVNHPNFLLWTFRLGFLGFSTAILWHSKKYRLIKIMRWEMLGIGFSLLMAIIFALPATAGVAHAIRFTMSTAVALIIIGTPIYMLFLVIIMRHTPTHQRIRTWITVIVTIVATVLFFLMLFYPWVLGF